MVARLAIGFLWLIGIGLLAAAMTLPRMPDIFYHDRYFTVPRWSLTGLILVGLIAPLLVASIRWLRAANR